MLPDKRDRLIRAIATVSMLERGVIRTSLPDSALLMILYPLTALYYTSVKLVTVAATQQTFANKEPQYGHLHQIAGGA